MPNTKPKKQTTKELKKEYLQLYALINGECPCYGKSDLFRINYIEQELNKRGVSINLTPQFN